MAVTIKDVEYVAKLARLEFDDVQKEKFTHELNDILKYVEKLSEVDTDNVDISISSYPMYNALREDEEKLSLDRETILKNAPDREAGYFKVPKVID
jgi:aspartyl-tRNA(Asn)/glutamyl-tRNA(Gln) amidotransferase subunit C